MLGNRVRIVVLIGVLVSSIACAGSFEKEFDPHLRAVLDARVESVTSPNVSSDPAKIDSLFKSIETLARRSKEADRSLVDLLDYYLGEGPGTDVDRLILERGKRMVPILDGKKRRPLNCLPAYKSICFDDLEGRNRRIDFLVKEIKSTK